MEWLSPWGTLRCEYANRGLPDEGVCAFSAGPWAQFLTKHGLQWTSIPAEDLETSFVLPIPHPKVKDGDSFGALKKGWYWYLIGRDKECPGHPPSGCGLSPKVRRTTMEGMNYITRRWLFISHHFSVERNRMYQFLLLNPGLLTLELASLDLRLSNWASVTHGFACCLLLLFLWKEDKNCHHPTLKHWTSEEEGLVNALGQGARHAYCRTC